MLSSLPNTSVLKRQDHKQKKALKAAAADTEQRTV